jgi:microcystin degradation protein MlrC
VLRVLDTRADIDVVVTSIRNQCLDLAQFTHFGLDPTAARIVVVKSTAHFRADFEPIAASVIPVAAPGLFPCELSVIQNNLNHGHSCLDRCVPAR